MAVVDIVVALATPGAVMAYARQLIEDQLPSIVNGDLTLDWVFATNHDYRSLVIRLHFTPGTDETHFHLICTSLYMGRTLPLLMLVRDPGYCGTYATGYYVDPTAVQHWADTWPVWVATVVAIQGEMAIEWAVGAIQDLNVAEGTFGVGRFAVLTSATTLSAEGQILVATDTLRGVSWDTAPYSIANQLYDVDASSRGSVVTTQSKSDQSIADSLQTIADRDVDVSFNNGQAVFSVRGKTSIGL